MTLPQAAATATASRRAAWPNAPGLRAFRSQPFRISVGLTVLAAAVALMVAFLVRQANDPLGQYGIDVAVYQTAVRDLAAGISPYPPIMLSAPIAAQDMLYKYPLPFAQLIWPLGDMSAHAANTVWGLIQAALAFAAVWLAASFGGARPGRERLLWTGVAVALYMPFWDSIWKGNVSVVQAFQAALMLGPAALSGVGVASAILLKTSPLAVLPAALLSGGTRWRWVVATLLIVLTASILLAPAAWLDFLGSQVNLLIGRYTYASNLAPASMAGMVLPELPLVAAAIRIATVGVGIACVVAAIVFARRERGWPTAVVLGFVAALIIPGAAWYHYLAVLLPLAAFAWPSATRGQRIWLGLGFAVVTVGLASIPVAFAGACLLVVATLFVVRPSRAEPMPALV